MKLLHVDFLYLQFHAQINHEGVQSIACLTDDVAELKATIEHLIYRNAYIEEWFIKAAGEQYESF